MAVGNIEAIRDWMSDNWYNFEQMNDVLACGAIHLYNKESEYYCDKIKEINRSSSIHFRKVNEVPCYNAGFKYPNAAKCDIVLISKEPDGVKYNYTANQSGDKTYGGTFVMNGITWYYSTGINLSYNGYGNGVTQRYIGIFDSVESAGKELYKIAHTGNLL